MYVYVAVYTLTPPARGLCMGRVISIALLLPLSLALALLAPSLLAP